MDAFVANSNIYSGEPAIVQSETAPMELDICSLLQSMKLNTLEKQSENAVAAARQADVHDGVMSEDPNYQSDGESVSSNSSSSTSRNEPCGCMYLQTIRSQMDNYATTGGEYLEAIFTHREIFFSYPLGHQQCARAFSDIAYMLEQRAWRADRDADVEAVTAFRHEAWMIAASLEKKPDVQSKVRCSRIMPLML